ncbi:MAG TPA: lipase family protein, partial [Microthrixaceae bacterium]|nr:lipase family protein [Microthrixaceae bacterium]
RTMPVEAPSGEVGLRIMYHSTDAEGDDRAVTGVVYFPTGEAPEGGWPILAWAHGTSGLAAKCAPSRNPKPPPDFGVRGVRVATDYIGLGPEGELHPYLSAAAEAHAVIDSVTAVRAVPDAHAGEDWVVVGVSQGGHAALVTNEAAAERLPESNLLGAVAIAPGSQLGDTYGDDIQARLITTLVLVGAAAEDDDVDLGEYLSPPVLEASAVIEHGCMGEITPTLVSVATLPDYFLTDPRTAPLGQAWLEENDPGQVAAESPVLVVQGGKDLLVLPRRTAALIDRMCSLGQVVERLDVPTGDHDTVTEHGRGQITTWVAARFAGEPVTDGC